MRKFWLFLFLLLVPSSLSARWHEATSDHFVIYADSDEAWVRNFAEELEKFDRGVRRLRNLPNPNVGANRVTMYIVAPSQFSELTDSRSVGGFYSPRARGSVAFLPQYGGGSLKPQQVLFHEYTHHIYAVAWSGLALPGWLSEGLAEFHASAEFRGDGSIVFGREPPYREWSLASLTNDEIRQMLIASTEITGESVYYSGGWLLTHYLTFEEDRQDQLGKYLVAINQGKSLEASATEAFGQLNRLHSDLTRYRRGTSLPALVVPAADLATGPIRVRALTAGEEAIMPVRIQSEAGVTAEEAPKVFAQAKEVAARYPDEALVQRVLAEAAYDADDYEAALAAAEKAIALEPENARAHAYKAMTLLAQADNDGTRDAAEIGPLRQAIEAGLAVAPRDAELLWLSYRSYLGGSAAIPGLVRNRLLQAYLIAPQASDLRLAAAHQLLMDNRPDEARAVIRPLAFSAHQSGLTKRARATLDRIESGDITGATEVSKPKPGDDEETGEDGDGGDGSGDSGKEPGNA